MWFIIESNKRKTAIFLFFITVFLLFFGAVLGFSFSTDLYEGTYYGTAIGALISLVCLIFIIFYVNAKSSEFFLNQADAVKVCGDSMPVLRNVVEEMAISSALGFIPKIYLIESPVPNAFAVGINEKNSAVAVTTGLLSILNRDELQGVIAHEISHIKNKDTLYLMYSGVILGVIIAVSDFIIRAFLRSSSRRSKGAGLGIFIAVILALLSPVIVRILYFTISRKREFLADACACQYTRYPTGLASALYKISRYEPAMTDKEFIMDEKAASNKLLNVMYIHNFIQANKPKTFLSGLFTTHPSIDDRINILKSMGAADIEEYAKRFSIVVANKNIISRNKLASLNLAPIPVVVPAVVSMSVEEEQNQKIKEERKTRQREAKDAYKQAKNYKIIKCDCETILKIPPEYNRSAVICPHCKQVHEIK